MSTPTLPTTPTRASAPRSTFTAFARLVNELKREDARDYDSLEAAEHQLGLLREMLEGQLENAPEGFLRLQIEERIRIVRRAVLSVRARINVAVYLEEREFHAQGGVHREEG